jgi:hypothetical protein
MDAELSAEAILLWEAVVAERSRISQSLRGQWASSTSEHAYFTSAEDAASGLLHLRMLDGSSRVFRVVARRGWPSQEIEVTVDRWYHNDEEHWQGVLSEPLAANQVIIKAELYEIRPDAPADTPGYCLGYGGAKHVIRFHDGREVTTRNLWHCGTVPPVFRDRLPDNASFVHEYPQVAS